jgi:hypothetical protein
MRNRCYIFIFNLSAEQTQRLAAHALVTLQQMQLLFGKPFLGCRVPNRNFFFNPLLFASCPDTVKLLEA